MYVKHNPAFAGFADGMPVRDCVLFLSTGSPEDGGGGKNPYRKPKRKERTAGATQPCSVTLSEG